MRQLSLAALLLGGLVTSAVANNSGHISQTRGMESDNTVNLRNNPGAANADNSKSGIQVISSQELAPGIVTRIVKDSRGRIYRDLIKNGVATPPPEVKLPKENAVTENASLYESFEAWNGELDWIPEGWTEINTEENLPTTEMCERNINNTWYGGWTGDGYWTDITQDGEKECFIHFTYDVTYMNDNGDIVTVPHAPQDEWLITPNFDVKQGQKLFFDLEIDAGALYSYNWDTGVYDRNSTDHDLELLVSENNGESWESIWLASKEIAEPYTDQELYNLIAVLKYRHVSVDLSKYYGKTIKLAFKYTNAARNGAICGNSMAIDAVTVDTPSAEAAYSLPKGTLFCGFTESLSAYDASYVIMPAYTDITWNSGSNVYTEKNIWNYYDADNGDMSGIFEGDEMTLSYPWSKGVPYSYPILTAENQFSSHFYSFDGLDEKKGGIIYGGEMPRFQNERFALTNADYAHKSLITPVINDAESNETSYCFGTSRPNLWGDGYVPVSIGNAFEMPLAPVAVDGILVTLGALDADDDAVFTANIYAMDKYGSIDETPLASSTVKSADAIKSDGFANLVFKFDNTFVFNEKIIVEISGFNSEKVREFGVCTQYDRNTADSNTAYMKMSVPYDGAMYDVWYAASELLRDYSNSLYVGLIGSFNLINTEKSEISIPASVSEESVFVESNCGIDVLKVIYDGESYPLDKKVTLDWLNVSAKETEDGYTVTFNADPADMDREMAITLSVPGAETSLTVSQDKNSGIDFVDGSKEVILTQYYNTLGQPVSEDTKGIVIRKVTYSNGASTVSKSIKN